MIVQSIPEYQVFFYQQNNEPLKKFKQIMIFGIKQQAGQQKMIKKKLWLMNNSQFESFERYRLERYRASEIRREIDDHPLTKYYTYIIVHFFRKRKISKDDPFKAERLIHTAVCLFKRFHLVNEYNQLPLTQNIFVCIYLSLKINELPHDAIVQYANAWKNKDTLFLGDQCFHFKDPGYSEKQLHFLRGIGFQIGRSPLIPAVQSLFHRISERLKNNDLTNEILDFILELIRRVYIDDKAIFFFQGPKLALAIVILAIKSKQAENKIHNKMEELLGSDIFGVLERNRIQVEDIIEYVGKLQKIESKELSSRAKQLKEKILKLKKHTYEVPERKSPKLAPQTFEFEEH